jgi:hypothetical protein
MARKVSRQPWRAPLFTTRPSPTSPGCAAGPRPCPWTRRCGGRATGLGCRRVAGPRRGSPRAVRWCIPSTATCSSRCRVLLPAKGSAVYSAALQPTENGTEHRIAAQVVVVDQVLVAEHDAKHTRADHGEHVGHDAHGHTLSVKQAVNRSTSLIALSVAPSSRAPAFEVIVPPPRPATRSRRPRPARPHRLRVTLCPHRRLRWDRIKCFLNSNFRR